MQLAILRDAYRFARQDITEQLVAQDIKGHALGGNHVLAATALSHTLAYNQRADTVWITESHQSEA